MRQLAIPFLCCSIIFLLGWYGGVNSVRRDMAREYPYLYNFADDERPGMIWLTNSPDRDTFAVHVYRNGWKRLYWSGQNEIAQ